MTVLVAEMVLPRICCIPDYVSTSGEEAVELAAAAGLDLDEWQRYVLVHSLGEREDGRWAAPTVGIVVGRQNGKNAILEARELAGLFLLGERLIIHSAHEQATSSEHFRRLVERIEGTPELSRRVLKVVRGKGAEAIELRSGQRILFKTRTGGGGRGFAEVDLIVYDEAMILSAAAKAAVGPTQAAGSMHGNPQAWYSGSAVDQLNPKHDGYEFARVRRQAMEGKGQLAWFEWSVPVDSPDEVTDDMAADPEMQRMANPSMGIRISPDWIEHERETEFGPREFAVERLSAGDWPDPDADEQQLISREAWAALEDPTSRLQEPICVAFDVSPDRTTASIAAAGANQDGDWHVEIPYSRHGVGWLKQTLVKINETRDVARFVCDDQSPAASLVTELEQLEVKVDRTNAGELAQACGRIVDAVNEQTLRHLGSLELMLALRSAKTRPLGDRWAWTRRPSAGDITPLVAATLALWAAIEEADNGVTPAIY